MNSEILDRLPPSDIDAERGVIGSILLKPSVLDDIDLRADEFWADANRKLYARLSAMHDAGKRIDTTLLMESLKAAGELEAVGGAAYIAEVLHSVPVWQHATHYAAIVRDKAILRGVIHAACDSLQNAYDPCMDGPAVLNTAELLLSAVGDANIHRKVRPFSEVALSAARQIQAAQERGNRAGIMTGLYDLDRQSGGLFGGELVILAARPSGGKTAFACHLAKNGSRHGPVYFASMEMDAEQLWTRMASAEAGVPMRDIRAGTMNNDQREAMTEAQNVIAGLDIYADDRPDMTVQDIRRAARRMKRHGLSMMVVDYLQLVTPASKRIDRHLQVGEMSRALKQTARELDVPLVCLAQLSRAAEQADRPKMGHLRESGSIEQDADVIMFLVPGDFTNENGERWNLELDRAKDRIGGTTGTFRLRKDGGRFECIDQPVKHSEFERFEQREAF